MKININDRVRVKLTPHGKIIMAMNEYSVDKPDADGWLELPLWELMWVFGQCMFHGNPNLPFEGNEIELKTRKHVGWRWKHADTPDDGHWHYTDGVEKPDPGFTTEYAKRVVWQEVYA